MTDERLHAALRARWAPVPTTRLLAFGSDLLHPADAAAVAHLAVVGTEPWPAGSASVAVAADPLRLPFIEALFDIVVVAGVIEASDAPAVLLREVRRVVAPAGVVWLVTPRRWPSLGHGLPGHHFSRARLERLLVEAMLEPVDWEGFGGCSLVRAEPRGGSAAAPIGRGATARVRATA